MLKEYGLDTNGFVTEKIHCTSEPQRSLKVRERRSGIDEILSTVSFALTTSSTVGGRTRILHFFSPTYPLETLSIKKKQEISS